MATAKPYGSEFVRWKDKFSWLVAAALSVVLCVTAGPC
jgi:hypothetical protein